MQNKILLTVFMLFIFGPFFLTQPGFAENPQNAEEKEETLEIKGGEAKRIEEEQKLRKPKKIEVEEGVKIPEVPQPLKEELSPADKVKLSNLEQKRAEGKVNELQYDLEKDRLGRESNIKY
ncbi:MAG: hypothetical protein HYZ84_07000 [Candidatus Omnitrophica bacterium]|nr:hypothetical protein [Candidatus Omnitrophota bacterium]